jgi:hypothetical protein
MSPVLTCQSGEYCIPYSLDLQVGPLITFTRDLQEGFQYFESFGPDHWKTPFPKAAFKWALMASEGAISQTHMDAGGFATHIQVQLGSKLWFILQNLACPSVQDGWVEDGKNDSGEELVWHVVVLQPGDDL